MLNHPLVSLAFYSLLALIILLILLIAILIFKILVEIFELAQQRADQTRVTLLKNAQKRAAQILDEAHKTAHDTLAESSTKAKEYLTETIFAADTLRGTQVHMLEDYAKKQEEQLARHTEELKVQYASTVTTLTTTLTQNIQQLDQAARSQMQTALSTLNTQIAGEVDFMHDEITKRVEESHTAFEEKSSSAYQELLTQLNDYKKQKTEQIDKSVNRVLVDISKRVFGRTLTLEEHQDYILKTLEDAKQLLNE